MVTPDGMPLVWISRWRGFEHVERVYGPDLLLACCERCLLEVKNAICSLGRRHVSLLSVFGPAPYRRSARSAASCRCRWVSLEYVSATSF